MTDDELGVAGAPAFAPLTDGVVTLRPPRPEDAPALVAGRDAEFRRWMGDGTDQPNPTACIRVGDDLVGWVDHDWPRAWLGPGEVNVGYAASAGHRGRGYITRAVQLLAHLLAVEGRHHTMTVLIRPDNRASLAVADRTGFERTGIVDGSVFARRPVPPLVYSDGLVTLRPQAPSDLERHLESIDDVQIDRLWLPGQRESWEAMSAEQQRAHVLRWITTNQHSFTTGPAWNFAVDAPDGAYVAFVNCDLANPHVPAGEANISYSAHPAHRARGHVSRGVRLALRFLREHTGARTAHVVVEADNVPSLRVARAVGAAERERWRNDEGRTMVRHVIDL